PVLSRFVIAASVCNEARLVSEEGTWKIEGNPTEGALLALAHKAGLDPEKASQDWGRLDAIPFESDHKFMATLNDSVNERRIFIKGAPEAVLGRCEKEMDREGNAIDLDKGQWELFQDDLAGEGFRILAVAEKEPGKSTMDDLGFEDVEGGFTLLGLAAIMDPPRPEAKEAVEECRRAGIRVKMITGDHSMTAAAIASQMGIGTEGRVITGPEIEKATDDELVRLAEEIDVFARVSPEHKLRLVTALQKLGYITAMTGDGVNDAPALKKADIGIAMGLKGTEAAKEAAEMVLADDNFASIVHAVEEGRTVYDNLKKTLMFMLPTNGGEALLIIVAIALGMVVPITPAQILWVNMVTAITLALTLAFEPMEADVMDRPPRPAGEPLVQGSMLLRILYVSLLLMGSSLGMFSWYLSAGATTELARTIAVNTLIIGEIFYLFNSRYILERSLSLRGLRATPQVW
ncbi:MAG: HAD-IC family P-type ATPase, partial [Thermovirgaceae bacterium]|nr:HAD-IC family P-type ATPase [Thermovirgaceae bacterium]